MTAWDTPPEVAGQTDHAATSRALYLGRAPAGTETSAARAYPQNQYHLHE